MPRNHANRLLGYADDARLLIVNADDFGMCELVNEATLRAMQEGVVRSTSLMAPWPGASEAMRMLRENPDVPFGVHLTVVCDMPGSIRDSSLTSVFRVRARRASPPRGCRSRRCRRCWTFGAGPEKKIPGRTAERRPARTRGAM
jgi:hypothetical protein